VANFKPRYTNAGQIKLYLRKKASYGLSAPDVMDSITTQQINAFITQAEARVGIDLSRQYLIPFVGTGNTEFSTLPQDTQLFIQEMCNWKTVLLILEVYYGNSDGVRGEDFKRSCNEQYMVLLNQAKGLDENNQYMYPPLDGLALNPNASYRTVSGAASPKSVAIGSSSCDNANNTKNKLTNLNKSLLYGWRSFGRGGR
jgi:hypothetical protein